MKLVPNCSCCFYRLCLTLFFFSPVWCFVVLHRPPDGGPGRWYKFDDNEVSECKMDDDEEMKAQCFGGEYMTDVYDHITKLYVPLPSLSLYLSIYLSLSISLSIYLSLSLSLSPPSLSLPCSHSLMFLSHFHRMAFRRQKRWWNAYILFYERVDEPVMVQCKWQPHSSKFVLCH